MKSYACYPGTRFQSPVARFVTPYYPTQTVRHQASQSPAVNILREEGSYALQLAVPGLTKNDIKIEVNDGQLIISAAEVKNESNPNFVRREFDFNGFKRSFRLHKNANTEAMTATFDQGILTITIPDRE